MTRPDLIQVVTLTGSQRVCSQCCHVPVSSITGMYQEKSMGNSCGVVEELKEEFLCTKGQGRDGEF